MLVKPLWPVAEYIMNYDYIKDVLCENKDRPMMNCDGKCYLAKMLAKEAEKHEKNPFGEKQSKTEIQPLVYLEFLPQLGVNFDFEKSSLQQTLFIESLTSTLLAHDIVQPPELV